MKKYQKIALCIAFSLAAQCGVLCYADKILLRESDNFNIETIEVPIKTFDTNIEVPSEAKDIKVSYGGKYIIYLLNNKIVLINTKRSESREILSNTQILDCKWVPKNNTLYIVEKKDNSIKVKTYNADSDIEQDINVVCEYKEGMSAQAYISHSQQYIAVDDHQTTNIYRIDIEKQVSKLNDIVNKLSSADVFWDDDIFIYQSSEDKALYKYTCGNNFEISSSSSSKQIILKAVDKSVFLGELHDDNKISKILYSDDVENTSSWKVVDLDSPRDIKDIYITEKSEVIINDSIENRVTNISNGKSMPYKGEFIAINDRVLCSIEEGKISLKSVKETL